MFKALAHPVNGPAHGWRPQSSWGPGLEGTQTRAAGGARGQHRDATQHKAGQFWSAVPASTQAARQEPEGEVVHSHAWAALPGMACSRGIQAGLAGRLPAHLLRHVAKAAHVGCPSSGAPQPVAARAADDGTRAPACQVQRVALGIRLSSGDVDLGAEVDGMPVRQVWSRVRAGWEASKALVAQMQPFAPWRGCGRQSVEGGCGRWWAGTAYASSCQQQAPGAHSR